MTYATIALGLMLLAVGALAYLVTGRESWTALLPAILGLPILLLGLLALREGVRRHAIHAALVLALLGVIGTAMQWIELPALIAGEEVERPGAVVTAAITAAACLVYVVVGVRSFVAARRERRAAAGGE